MKFIKTVKRQIERCIVKEDAELNQETRLGQRPARMVGFTRLDQKAHIGMEANSGVRNQTLLTGRRRLI